MKSKKVATVARWCVACGVCMGQCKLKAIGIPDGTKAIIDTKKCVGCGKCAKVCPANAICIVEREAMQHA